MASDYFSVDRDARSRANKDLIANGNLTDANFLPFSVPADSCDARQEINQALNRLAASTDRQTLQNLCHEDKKRDDESGKNLANSERSDDGYGHREFHRHAALGYVFVCFVKDRKAANQGAYHADRSDVGIRRTAKKPDGPRRRSDKQDAVDVPPVQGMSVFVFVVSVAW
jgi:hypothetical protein